MPWYYSVNIWLLSICIWFNSVPIYLYYNIYYWHMTFRWPLVLLNMTLYLYILQNIIVRRENSKSGGFKVKIEPYIIIKRQLWGLNVKDKTHEQSCNKHKAIDIVGYTFFYSEEPILYLIFESFSLVFFILHISMTSLLV